MRKIIGDGEYGEQSNTLEQQSVTDQPTRSVFLMIKNFTKQACMVLGVSGLIVTFNIDKIIEARVGKYDYDAVHIQDFDTAFATARRNNAKVFLWRDSNGLFKTYNTHTIEELYPDVYELLRPMKDRSNAFLTRPEFAQGLEILGVCNGKEQQKKIVNSLNDSSKKVRIAMGESTNFYWGKAQEKIHTKGLYNPITGDIYVEYDPGFECTYLHELMHSADVISIKEFFKSGLLLSSETKRSNITDYIIENAVSNLIDTSGCNHGEFSPLYFSLYPQEIFPRIVSIIHFYNHNVGFDLNQRDVSVESLKDLLNYSKLHFDARQLLFSCNLEELSNLIYILIHGEHKSIAMTS